MIIRKIDLRTLIEALQHAYDGGVDFIDIIGAQGEDQDMLSIRFGKDYMSPEHAANWDNLEGEENYVPKNIDLSGEDLNQLI
jgi:hypothetical protein